MQMLVVAAVDAIEVPRASNDFGIGRPGAGPPFHHEERFDIDFPIGQNLTFRLKRVRYDPNAVLHAPEPFGAQIASQGSALCVLSVGNIEHDEPPLSVPPPERG